MLDRANTANQAFRKARAFNNENAVLEQSYSTVIQPVGHSQDLLKDVLTAVGRVETYVNELSKKQEDAEKTIEHIVKKVLAKEKQAEQVEQESKKPEPTHKPVIEAVIEPETEKQNVENSETPRPSQRIATPLLSHIPSQIPTSIPTESNTVVSNTTELCFPPKLNHDQRYDAKKLLTRVDDDKAQMLLDMLTKRMRNTSNPVKTPIGYLTNLLTRLQNGRLDMPITTVTNSTAAPAPPTKPRALRESERRQAEYKEAVADCIQMEQNIKLLGRKDSLTFTESLDKFDLRGLWRSVRDRFTETKEALAAIQPLDGDVVSV